jgi:predicted NAD/FAD-binding protein
MRIAIVGSGVAGLVAARALHTRHDVTVFEADTRIGGHANTLDVEIDGQVYAVDTGFIVYNERNYPGFSALLGELRVETQPAEMSFSVTDERTGLEFRGTNPNTLYAQRRNVADPAFARMLLDIARFNRATRRLARDEPRWTGADRLAPKRAPGDDESLEQLVRRLHCSERFIEQFLVPLGSAVWSADPRMFLAFPARAYARFMHNHGLLHLGAQPRWRTVTGGSRRYVEALVAPFARSIRLATPAHKIVTRWAGGDHQVEVLTSGGPEHFDRVIVATHSDQALRLLADPTPAAREILGAIAFQPNVATLHTDERMLPRSRRARASWNYSIVHESRRATVTYWMNRLHSLDAPRPLLVTLNRSGDIDPSAVLAEIEYQHPVFDAKAMAAQHERARIQGDRGVFFAGAYWGYGFHEDGVQSGLEVVRLLERTQ